MNESQISKDLTLEEFRRFRDFIHEHSGIFLEEGKSDSLRISLITRATRFQFRTLDEYYDLLVGDDEEFKELLNLVTINETSFFRFPAQFDALRDRVLPEIMEGKTPGNKELRVWSAGCSTGEEPYSIAMAMLDMGMQGLGWQPLVTGTDVSTKALRMARTGVYSGRTLLNLSDDVLRRHFEETHEGYRVAGHVRKLVDFGYHNLIKEPYPLALMGNWDVIFCRNVTIYFQLDSTKRVVSNYFNSLNEGGYLFIGHSETLTNISDDFEAVEVGGVFLYRKPRRTRHVSFHAPRPETGRDRATRHGRDRAAEPAAAKPRRTAKERAGTGAKSSAASATDATALSEAQAALKAGEPRQALDRVAEIIVTDPNNVEAYLIAAAAHADVGDFQDALVECHKAIAIDPLQPTARYILGIIHQRQDDVVRAVSEYRKAIYIDPDYALAHLNLANIYRSQRRLDAACREYENAIRSFGSSPDGPWSGFLGGFDVGLLIQSCERSLVECRKVNG